MGCWRRWGTGRRGDGRPEETQATYPDGLCHGLACLARALRAACTFSFRGYTPMRLCGLLLVWCGLAAGATVPTPESHFGHKIGADRQLLDWAKVTSYFHALEQASDKIRVREYGKSVDGRSLIVATIAAPETLRHLDRYLEQQWRLADPRITTPAEAETFITGGKNVVLITCSIHATEVASTHSAVEFAHRLITEDSPRFRAILRNDIVLLVPSLNPDGVDIVTQWYRQTLGTPYEGSGPPELWQRYVGHDNNRDWYIFSQPETRATISQLHNVWHPQLVYDVHQQGARGARLFVPPWLDPIEPNIDPIVVQEMNMIGTSMASDLTASGKTGISINSTYDFWTPSRHYQAFHGGLRILTESASAKLASPITVKREEIETEALGFNPRERSWNYLEPWLGGTWRLRDIIDYQTEAFESCLYQAAIHREEMLRNFYRIGQHQVARQSPWGFVIPARQRDPGATRRMLETLAFGGVEIEKTAGGDHVIRMAQPYSGYAKALLEKQEYPDLRMYPGGPPRRPYDVTAQTLPLLFGVDVQTVATALSGPLEREQFGGTQPAAALAAGDTDSWVNINRIWDSGGQVWRNAETGDFATRDGGAPWKRVERPRIALYKSFVPSMDEGWTRWTLEQFHFRYSEISNTDVAAGALRKRFDVIVFPDQVEQELSNGFSAGAMPARFTGGLNPAAVEALRTFAQSGGTLLFFNKSALWATHHLGVGVKNVLQGVSNSEYYSPGSLLRVRLAAGSPLTLGLPEEIAIWSEQSPAFDGAAGSIATYPASNVLASGWLLGEKLLTGNSALVDVKTGEGHMVLFGMRPQYRAQSYQAYKLLFNALLDH